jgi:hypothetical protein
MAEQSLLLWQFLKFVKGEPPAVESRPLFRTLPFHSASNIRRCSQVKWLPFPPLSSVLFFRPMAHSQ